MAKLNFNRNFNVMRVVKRLIYTILGLYVGGTILTTFGSVMNGTCSSLYSGLSLIGWTVSSSATNTSGCSVVNSTNTITSTSGSGILSVIGIMAIASVALEFVSW